MSDRGLVDLSVSDLVALRAALETRALQPPVREAALQANGLGHLATALAPYAALDRGALEALLSAVLAERAHQHDPKLRLVWSGDDPLSSHARHTRVLLPELFARARKHVLVAGYSFDRPEELFAPLSEVMKAHGVTATFFVDVGQLEERLRQTARREKKSWHSLAMPLRSTTTAEERGKAIVDLFFQLMWPFDGPRPTVYFDPRTALKNPTVSLHAKCVVIDHALALITSANFTARGQNRNLEAGVSIEDETFAAALERQWSNLIEAGVVVR